MRTPSRRPEEGDGGGGSMQARRERAPSPPAPRLPRHGDDAWKKERRRISKYTLNFGSRSLEQRFRKANKEKNSAKFSRILVVSAVIQALFFVQDVRESMTRHGLIADFLSLNAEEAEVGWVLFFLAPPSSAALLRLTVFICLFRSLPVNFSVIVSPSLVLSFSLTLSPFSRSLVLSFSRSLVLSFSPTPTPTPTLIERTGSPHSPPRRFGTLRSWPPCACAPF